MSTALELLDVHVTLLAVPTCQLSPPLGVTTVNAGTGAIAKVASLESRIVALCTLTIRTRAVVVGAFGTVHAYEPVDAVTFVAIEVHEPFAVVL